MKSELININKAIIGNLLSNGYVVVIENGKEYRINLEDD